MHAAQAHGDGAPGQHEEGDPVAGPQALEHVVARDLEQGVGDQENHQGDCELEVGHFRFAQEVVAFFLVEDLGVLLVLLFVFRLFTGARERAGVQHTFALPMLLRSK